MKPPPMSGFMAGDKHTCWNDTFILENCHTEKVYPSVTKKGKLATSCWSSQNSWFPSPAWTSNILPMFVWNSDWTSRAFSSGLQG